MLLAFLIPGAGHFYLGKRARAIAFFCIVMLMFSIGLAIDGRIYTGGSGSLLGLLATLGTMGMGLPYVIAVFGPYQWPAFWNPHGDVGSITFEHGTAFTITAGLMNLLLMLDAFDISEGKKE
jgi:hypothetical protein